jgi:hypothetical protein
LKQVGTKIIRRMKTMENEKKYTPEEIRAIVDEELRKANLNPNKELNPDEMDNVSGGKSVTPSTHGEIDAKWDVIEQALKTYGADIALLTAQELDCMSGADGAWKGQNPFSGYPNLDRFRNRMHRILDGDDDPFVDCWVPRG